MTYLTYSVFDFFSSEILKCPVFNVFGVFTYLTFFIQILKCLVFNVFGVFTYLRIFASKILKCPVFSVFGVFTYLRFLQNFKVPRYSYSFGPLQVITLPGHHRSTPIWTTPNWTTPIWTYPNWTWTTPNWTNPNWTNICFQFRSGLFKNLYN